MNTLVRPNQSTFIKGRAIHDNFRAVQSSAKLLHARKFLTVLLKIDIARAIDTVSGSYLLELLQHSGFSKRWINWISILLSTASTRILLNGNPGQRICHDTCLKQGDPLSPLLFVMAMEALNALFRLADVMHIFTALCQFTPIQCSADQIAVVNQWFPCLWCTFSSDIGEFRYPSTS
jgi:hypothetical protein